MNQFAEQNQRKKLFGTDGIRGRANKFPITPYIALRVGQALGLLLKKKYTSEKELRVLIGKDTRLSGYMLEQALASGLNSMGVWVQLTGPLPTPGIGFLAQNMRVSAGVVISASHNPYYDNGIKIFLADGFKISSQQERQIEEWVFSDDLDSYTGEPGRTRRIVDATGRYIVFAKRSFPVNRSLKEIKLVLDCANGSAYKAAPAIFEELGAKVIAIGNKPDGFNINKESGALFPEKISDQVLKHQADIGISLDGDGDRVILSDEKGRVLNGDHILGICAMHLKAQGELSGNQVVATHLSNSGLESSLEFQSIKLLRTEVGDRNVVETMRQSGAVLGGESSGHIVFLNHTTTGDACVAALNVLGAMVTQNKTLSELRDSIYEAPQVSLSVPIDKRFDLEDMKGYKEMIASIKNRLDDSARILVRFSGTEPLLRILLEGPGDIKGEAHRLKDFLMSRLS